MISGMMIAVIVGIAAVAIGIGAYVALYPISGDKATSYTTTYNHGNAAANSSSTSGQQYSSGNTTTMTTKNPSTSAPGNAKPAPRY